MGFSVAAGDGVALAGIGLGGTAAAAAALDAATGGDSPEADADGSAGVAVAVIGGGGVLPFVPLFAPLEHPANTSATAVIAAMRFTAWRRLGLAALPV
ncbi:MAG: hypothetical protein ABI231_07830 [Candidatus Tumulicola sp.]